MDVRELNREQIDELKNTLFYGEFEEGDVDIDLSQFSFDTDIPDEVIFDMYGGINFVNDDFWCTKGVDDED